MSPSLLQLPILPLRDIVVFPHMIVPLFVGREKSIHALEAVMAQNKQILLLTQLEAATEDPQPKDMHKMGTIGNILQLLKLPDGTVKVLVEGVARARIKRLGEGRLGKERTGDKNNFLIGEAQTFVDPHIPNPDADLLALGRATLQQFEHYIKLNKKIASEVMASVNKIEEERQNRRHHRLTFSRQNSPKAKIARNHRCQRKARRHLRHHGRRNRCSQSRKTHPQSRQASDGKNPA